MSDRSATSRRWRSCWLAVAALALGLQLALLWMEWRPQPRPLWGDEATYWNAAAELRAGVDPDLHLVWPPLYPRLLAFTSWLGGGQRFATQLLQMTLLAAAALLLRALGRAIVPASPAGDVAAVLLLLDPQVAAYTVYLWPELLHLALFLFAWWVLATRADRWPWLAGAGVALGLALLTKSLLLAFVPVLLAPLLLAGETRHRILRPAVVLGALALVILPTLLAHRERYGVATIADSSRFNAWVGLNDRARRNFVDEIVGDELGIFLQSAPEPRGRNAIASDKIARLLEQRGPWSVLRAQLGRQYFRLFHRDSFFTEQLPGGGISARGFGYPAPPPWLASSLSLWAGTIYALTLVGAALAAGTAPAVDKRQALVAALFVAYNLALFLVLHVMSRYRVQFLPVLYLAAGVTAAELWRRRPLGAPAARVAGVAVAGLLLFLAFTG